MRLETFFENFELLADAPNGVQKLRELILQLAVRGKLVPQDPNDEPASVLLEKIKAEKERLVKMVKEKKIGEPDLLPPVEENDVSYNLPSSWAWVRLGEIVEYNGASKVSPSEIPQDAWLFELEDIEKDSSKIIQRFTFKERESKSSKAKFNKGDVLYGKLRPYLNKVVVADTDGFCTTEIVPLRGYLGIFPKYLMYALKRPDFLEYVNSKTYGVKMPRLGTDEGRRAPFPLPPIKEQKRIVAKVDQLMALCDELETRQQKRREGCVRLNNAAIAQLLTTREPDAFTKHWQRICNNFDSLYSTPENIGKLRQAILQLAVQGKLVPQNPDNESASVLLEKIKAEKERLVKEKKIERSKPLPPIEADEIPFELPDSWKWVRLGEVTVFGPKNGYSPKPVDYVTNVKSLTLSATTSGEFNEHCFKYIDEKIDVESHLWLEEGDLLIQRGNTIEYVGVAAVYKGLSQEFIYPDLMMKIRFSKYVNVDYLHKAINNNSSRNFFRERATGTSGSMPKINQTTVTSLPIPLPPREEQKRIVAKVNQLMSLCDALEAKLTQSQTDSEKLMDAAVRQVLTA